MYLTTLKLIKLTKKLNKKGQKLNDIFYDIGENNSSIFQELLDILNSTLNEQSTEKDLYKNLCSLWNIFELDSDSEVVRKLDDDVRFQIHDTLCKFLNFHDSGYLDVKDGVIVTQDLKQDTSAKTEFITRVSKCKIKGADGLIDKNGDFYLALYEHDYMVNYLLAMGVDLSGALRVFNSHYNKKDFALSSFYIYKRFSDKYKVFENDKFLPLSRKQVLTFRDIFSIFNGHMQDIEKIIYSSENLGFNFVHNSYTSAKNEFNYDVAKQNLEIFESIFDDVDFESFKKNFHDRMVFLKAFTIED